MKRIWVCLLALVTALSFAACEKNGPPEPRNITAN